MFNVKIIEIHFSKMIARQQQFSFIYCLRKSLDEAGREVWLYNGTYWKLRQNPGFTETENLDLW